MAELDGFQTITDPNRLDEIKKCLVKEGFPVDFTPRRAVTYNNIKVEGIDQAGWLKDTPDDLVPNDKDQSRREKGLEAAVSEYRDESGQMVGRGEVRATEKLEQVTAKTPGSISTKTDLHSDTIAEGRSPEDRRKATAAVGCFNPPGM